MSTKIRLPRSKNFLSAVEWLDKNIPNPPLPEAQRWNAIDDVDSETRLWHTYIEFADEQDAIMFSLSVHLYD